MRRFFYGLAFAMLVAVVPASAHADDQAIANHLVEQLRTAQQNGSLKDFSLDMNVKEGVVWFKGTVATSQQEQMVLRTAQLAKNLGVVKIVDEISVRPDVAAAPVKQASMATGSSVRQTTAVGPSSSVLPPTRMAALPTTRPTSGLGAQTPLAARPAMGMGFPAVARRQGQQMSAPSYNPASAPVSASAAGATYDHPNMPNYSWPSYASHPNYAAVQYPQQYSPTAWPYIGPFYPYPQVPLGWRKVSLEWDDGWWFLDFHDK